MINSTTSSCIRCGKPRVVVGTHTEVIGNSTVSYTDTACPDPDCQTKVDDQLDKDRVKREQSASLHKPRGFTTDPKSQGKK